MAGRLSERPPVRRDAATWRRRRAAALAVAAAVIAIHGCVADLLGRHLVDFRIDAAMPKTVEVAYVRELELAAPPAAAPVPAQSRPKRPSAPPPATVPTDTALGPEPAQPVPSPDHAARSVPEPEPQMAEAAAPTASAPEPAASAPPGAEPVVAEAVGTSASAPPFEWPVSTRLSYVLTGHYRGEIHGRAQVEWVRMEDRYQMHLDVTVGLPFAPLFTRAMTSEGRLTPDGLKPLRYDEDSKMAFGERRRVAIRFEPYGIVLPDGHVRLGWSRVQDAASQFVQLTYLFTTQPEQLVVGNRVELTLALPRQVDRWTYDVQDIETLYTPFGAVQAFHLVPRRKPTPGGDLTAEMWFAPALAYLPVRIRIWQDDETFIDLMIDRKPQLAAQ